jgi:hypothetical protein
MKNVMIPVRNQPVYCSGFFKEIPQSRLLISPGNKTLHPDIVSAGSL